MNYPPAPGGLSTRAYNLVKGLEKNNVESIVISSFPRGFSGNVNLNTKKAFYYDVYENSNIIRVFIPSFKNRNFLSQLIQFIFFCEYKLAVLFHNKILTIAI